MNRIFQPNRWTCLPCSFAMCLGVTLEWMIHELGHDGSDIIWPELPEPKRRRGFHIQECIDIAIDLGYGVTPIEGTPVSIPTLGARPFDVFASSERMLQAMRNNIGVLVGRGHATAWDGTKKIDPCPIDNPFRPETFWLVQEVQSAHSTGTNQARTIAGVSYTD